MPDIGETLREARMRARIDVSEIEAKTKIRAKYLRALENEEWGLLPGPTFVKSFLRTYAQALGLDGKALVEEYRSQYESPAETLHEPISSGTRRPRASGAGGPGAPRGGGGGSSRAYLALVGGIGVLIVLLIVGLAIGGGSSKKHAATTAVRGATNAAAPVHHRTGPSTAPQSARVALFLHATATVYVCLLGDGGRKLIPGIELQPGATTPTYHARRFEITLGNNAVTMVLDGTARTVPASSRAIGYSITKGGGRRPLQPGQQPTCA